MNPKYLLARPQGGLNDVLNQIEKTIRYGTAHNRRILLDFSGHPLMREFFDLVEINSPEVEISIDNGFVDRLGLNFLTTFPPELAGRVDTYTAARKSGAPRSQYFDTESGVRISFDFSRDYHEGLLIHHEEGGGKKSFPGIMRLALKPGVLDELDYVTPKLPDFYYSAHIRATDYQTDYGKFFASLKRKIGRTPLLVCSDNNEVVWFARNFFPTWQLLSFSDHSAPAGTPLHRQDKSIGQQIFRASAVRLMAEILALSRSNRFFFTSIYQAERWKRVKFSGFSELIAYVVSNRGAIPLLRSQENKGFPDGKVVRLISVREHLITAWFRINNFLKSLQRLVDLTDLGDCRLADGKSTPRQQSWTWRTAPSSRR